LQTTILILNRRLSTLNLTNAHVNQATTLLSGVSNKVNSSGYLTQVANPNDFSKEGSESPEGQSFVIMGYAAYKQWVKMGSPGGTNGTDPLGESSAAALRTGVGLSVVLGSILAGVVSIF
jgi:hypothetical protein